MENIFKDLTEALFNAPVLLNDIYLEANKRYVCDQINASGFAYIEPADIPESWGITAQTMQPTLDRLVNEYIEYRTDKSRGRL